MSLAESADTARMLLPLEPGLGLGTMLHSEPFQCSVSVRGWPEPALKPPMAHISPEDSAEIDQSPLGSPAGLGLGTMLHCVPSQCSTRVSSTSGPMWK